MTLNQPAPRGASAGFAERLLEVIDSDRTSLLRLLSSAHETFSPDSTLIFEHGEPETGPLRTGACIDHAHLHILPGHGYLIDKIICQLPFDVTCWSLEETMERANLSGYHLVGKFENNGSEMYLRSVVGPTPSQFLRRLVADAAGTRRSWDWRENWDLASVEQTCRLWRSSAHANIV